MDTYDAPAIKKKTATKYVMPDTARDFRCIMSACEDNCCRNTTWTITVDPDSYKKYQSIEGEVGQRILGCIEDTGTVLKFKEFGDGKCPLMLESGLCYIHKELGGDFLCRTCATYPRVYNYFNRNMEHWLSLSCPEVVRHVLYRKKSISFVESPVAVASLPVENPFDADKASVRDMLAKIISFRKLTVKEKMLYMAVFVRSITKLNIYAPDYGRTFRKTIKNYTNGLRDARKMLAEATEKLGTVDEHTRNSILVALSRLTLQVSLPPKMFPEGIENAEYYAMMAEFHKDVASGMVIKYLLGTFDGKIVPYVNSKPHVFENYLMYVLMSSLFLAETHDYAKAFAGFSGELCAMLVFACMFHSSEAFGDEEMVVAMYLFHRRISHNQKLRQALAKMFSDNVLAFLLGALGGIN